MHVKNELLTMKRLGISWFGLALAAGIEADLLLLI